MADCVDVGVAEEFLDGDDVAAAFQESRGVSVAEFMQRCVFNSCLLGDGFESSEQMRLSSGLSRISRSSNYCCSSEQAVGQGKSSRESEGESFGSKMTEESLSLFPMFPA